MTLRLNGSTSGYTEIDAPATAGNNNLKLPTGNGSAGNILGTDGAGNLSWVNGRMVLATAQASTSGTSVDFTGIPSWVKRVTVMLNGVSTSGTSNIIVQLGASSFSTSGYISTSSGITSTVGTTQYTAGFGISNDNQATTLFYGALAFSNITGNAWTLTGNISTGTNGKTAVSAGFLSLAGTLDRLRITTVNGTDTFDAGSINILYEG
jgi:hypothetical protein